MTFLGGGDIKKQKKTGNFSGGKNNIVRKAHNRL